MTEKELDPAKGREVAGQLRALGVRGILITAAEQGYITQLECAMPECHCPEELGGKTFFEHVPESIPEWVPTPDHINLKSEGGKLTVENVRLAHRLCNRVDFAKNHGKPFDKDLARAERARELAISAIGRAGIPRDERWPGRRDRILSHMAELWARWPDMRFGQLVEVLLDRDGATLFNLEDDEIERLLQAAIHREKGSDFR